MKKCGATKRFEAVHSPMDLHRVKVFSHWFLLYHSLRTATQLYFTLHHTSTKDQVRVMKIRTNYVLCYGHK